MPSHYSGPKDLVLLFYRGYYLTFWFPKGCWHQRNCIGMQWALGGSLYPMGMPSMGTVSVLQLTFSFNWSYIHSPKAKVSSMTANQHWGSPWTRLVLLLFLFFAYIHIMNFSPFQPITCLTLPAGVFLPSKAPPTFMSFVPVTHWV